MKVHIAVAQRRIWLVRMNKQQLQFSRLFRWTSALYTCLTIKRPLSKTCHYRQLGMHHRPQELDPIHGQKLSSVVMLHAAASSPDNEDDLWCWARGFLVDDSFIGSTSRSCVFSSASLRVPSFYSLFERQRTSHQDVLTLRAWHLMPCSSAAQSESSRVVRLPRFIFLPFLLLRSFSCRKKQRNVNSAKIYSFGINPWVNLDDFYPFARCFWETFKCLFHLLQSNLYHNFFM